MLLLALTLARPLSAQDTPQPGASAQPRVLVLYSNERLLPANLVVDEAIRATFSAELDTPAEFYTEFLDVDRFPGVIQQERTRDYLRDKYRKRPPDVLIAGGASALHFLVRQRPTLFARTPLVHCGVEPGEIPAAWPDDRIVGIPHKVDVVETLELALRLQPETRRVAIVDGLNNGGLSPADVPAMATRLEFLWLTNRSIPELREELSRLPDETVVFYGTMFRDQAGNAFTPRAALDQFAPASRVPIYGYYDTYLGHGIVGGSMVTFQTVGRAAAQIAVRILKGESPQEAIRGATHAPTPMWDSQQLRRWNISEERLPSGSVVLFRPPTIWEGHKRGIIGGAALFLIQAGLILGLIIQLRRRRRAEALARESESAAHELSGRLIHTQEEERSRIARDLHDDFNQRLALLSVEIDLLGRNARARDDTARLQQLGERARELSSDVHRLAYQLHPARLDQLGLVAAVSGLCRELSESSGVKVEIKHDNVPRELPADLGRCVYRVAQESLQNVIRHSGAKESRVELTAHNGQIRLLVSDTGKGFDLESARRSSGLGLLSMRERVRLSGGRLEIRALPGQGTQLELTIPMEKETTRA